MSQNEYHEIDSCLATGSTSECQLNATRTEDDAREKMVAARREQQRLLILRRLRLS